MGKYVNYDKLPKIIEQERSREKSIVLTGGCFDMLHRGHLYLLKKAKNLGDILVVNIVNDKRVKKYKGEKRPINNEFHRAQIISALEMVDYSTIHPSVDLGPTIELAIMIKPDIIVQGEKKWKEENKEHIRELLRYNVKLETIKRSRFKISTTSLIERILNIYKEL